MGQVEGDLPKNSSIDSNSSPMFNVKRNLNGNDQFCLETDISSLIIFDNFLAICFLLFSFTWMLPCNMLKQVYCAV